METLSSSVNRKLKNFLFVAVLPPFRRLGPLRALSGPQIYIWSLQVRP